MDFYLSIPVENDPSKSEIKHITDGYLRYKLLNNGKVPPDMVINIENQDETLNFLNKLELDIDIISTDELISKFISYLRKYNIDDMSVILNFDRIHLLAIFYLLYQNKLNEESLKEILNSTSYANRTELLLSYLNELTVSENINILNPLIKKIDKMCAYNNQYELGSRNCSFTTTDSLRRNIQSDRVTQAFYKIHAGNYAYEKYASGNNNIFEFCDTWNSMSELYNLFPNTITYTSILHNNSLQGQLNSLSIESRVTRSYNDYKSAREFATWAWILPIPHISYYRSYYNLVRRTSSDVGHVNGCENAYNTYVSRLIGSYYLSPFNPNYINELKALNRFIRSNDTYFNKSRYLSESYKAIGLSEWLTKNNVINNYNKETVYIKKDLIEADVYASVLYEIADYKFKHRLYIANSSPSNSSLNSLVTNSLKSSFRNYFNFETWKTSINSISSGFDVDRLFFHIMPSTGNGNVVNRSYDSYKIHNYYSKLSSLVNSSFTNTNYEITHDLWSTIDSTPDTSNNEKSIGLYDFLRTSYKKIAPNPSSNNSNNIEFTYCYDDELTADSETETTDTDGRKNFSLEERYAIYDFIKPLISDDNINRSAKNKLDNESLMKRLFNYKDVDTEDLYILMQNLGQRDMLASIKESSSNSFFGALFTALSGVTTQYRRTLNAISRVRMKNEKLFNKYGNSSSPYELDKGLELTKFNILINDSRTLYNFGTMDFPKRFLHDIVEAINKEYKIITMNDVLNPDDRNILLTNILTIIDAYKYDEKDINVCLVPLLKIITKKYITDFLMNDNNDNIRIIFDNIPVWYYNLYKILFYIRHTYLSISEAKNVIKSNTLFSEFESGTFTHDSVSLKSISDYITKVNGINTYVKSYLDSIGVTTTTINGMNVTLIDNDDDI